MINRDTLKLTFILNLMMFLLPVDATTIEKTNSSEYIDSEEDSITIHLIDTSDVHGCFFL